MLNNEIIDKAKVYAIEKHASVNHLYDGKPYDVHLERAYQYAIHYMYLIPLEYRANVLAAVWLHDVVEDCRITYNDLVKEFNVIIADLVYACSNEKGKTRKDRANNKYYRGIRKTFLAVFVKMCDRFANGSYSIEVGSRMFYVYKKEQESFEKSLKGTHTFFGKLRYFIIEFFDLKRVSYKIMFDDLNLMFLIGLPPIL